MAKEKKYNTLKLKFGRFFLKHALKEFHRQIKPCSIDKAENVGITFVVNDQEELEVIRKLLKKLNAAGLKTFALGYLPVKKPNEFYLSQKGFNFFSDADLDFALRPKSEAVIEFLATQFDLLIDFDTEKYFPMKYVLNTSKAKFKVGWFGDDQPYDLMMNIERKAGLEYFLDQTMLYLEKIK